MNIEFNIAAHSILSGGKPTFPTCEFPYLEWYPRAILIFHSFYHEVVLTSSPNRNSAGYTRNEPAKRRKLSLDPKGSTDYLTMLLSGDST